MKNMFGKFDPSEPLPVLATIHASCDRLTGQEPDEAWRRFCSPFGVDPNSGQARIFSLIGTLSASDPERFGMDEACSMAAAMALFDRPFRLAMDADENIGHADSSDFRPEDDAEDLRLFGNALLSPFMFLSIRPQENAASPTDSTSPLFENAIRAFEAIRIQARNSSFEELSGIAAFEPAAPGVPIAFASAVTHRGFANAPTLHEAEKMAIQFFNSHVEKMAISGDLLQDNQKSKSPRHGL